MANYVVKIYCLRSRLREYRYILRVKVNAKKWRGSGAEVGAWVNIEVVVYSSHSDLA